MKKAIFITAAISIYSFVNAQNLPVSQNQELRNAIIEEMTGTGCYACPSGHFLADSIYNKYPGEVTIVNYQLGMPQDYDMSTNEGWILQNFFNPIAIPTGALNRIPEQTNPTELTISRSLWDSRVSQLISETAEANIALDAKIDVLTRTLTVDVEVYYTSPQPNGTSHFLNVGILQNNIEDSQDGGWEYNPSAVLENGNYLHKHVFRKFINDGGVYGDSINAASTSVISESYVFNLPDSIHKIPLRLEDLKLFAFVHEGMNSPSNSKIINSLEVAPQFINMPLATAKMIKIVNELATCEGGFVQPIVRVENLGAEITSLQIAYSIGNGNTSYFDFLDTIAPLDIVDINLAPIIASSASQNICNVSITSVNNGFGYVSQNDSAQKIVTFETGIANNIAGRVQISYDWFSYDTKWKLCDDLGNIILQGYYPNGALDFLENVYFNFQPNTCYVLSVYDRVGDGFEDMNDGYVRIFSGLDLVASVESLEFEKAVAFNSGNQLLSTEDISLSITKIFPNPANNILNLNIQGAGDMIDLKILDMYGRIIQIDKLETIMEFNTYQIQTDQIENGKYFLVLNRNGLVETLPFDLNH